MKLLLLLITIITIDTTIIIIIIIIIIITTIIMKTKDKQKAIHLSRDARTQSLTSERGGKCVTVSREFHKLMKEKKKIKKVIPVAREKRKGGRKWR